MLKIRTNVTAAHIAPLAVFLLLTSLVPLIAVENPELPWWRSAPEHWIYPLQTLVCGGVLAFFWRNYTFRPARGFVLATVLGCRRHCDLDSARMALHDRRSRAWGEASLESRCWDTRRDSRDSTPRFSSSRRFGYAAVIGFRFLRLVVVVPLVEEIFWRGFLMRYVVAGSRPFERVPFGQHSWKAFGVTTAAFMLVHAKEDWLGALVFGSLMYFLCVRSKSLAACVWMHAVANLLLGIYVLKTRQWGFW